MLREYVWFGLMPVAMVVPDGAGGSDVYAVHTDQVMNPQKLTDAGGSVVWDRVITPFGETVSLSGARRFNIDMTGEPGAGCPARSPQRGHKRSELA